MKRDLSEITDEDVKRAKSWVNGKLKEDACPFPGDQRVCERICKNVFPSLPWHGPTWRRCPCYSFNPTYVRRVVIKLIKEWEK